MIKKELEKQIELYTENERRLKGFLDRRIASLEEFVSSSGVPHLNNLRYERLDELKEIKKFINQL